MVSSHRFSPGLIHPIEVVETVMGVADLAWDAYERRLSHDKCSGGGKGADAAYFSQLREENRRLRASLQENLLLLASLSKLPVVAEDCPPDLYAQLLNAVKSDNFSVQLGVLQASKDSVDGCFPFKEVQGVDLKSVDVVVYDDDEGKPSCWVWVSEELDKVEEESGIDGESYVIIGEDQIVDGIANFIARCILCNPKSKSLAQDELQKAVAKSLGSMKDASLLKRVWHAGKLIYSLSTWGLALAALYTHPTIVKVAAKGITTSGKLLLKAL